jgi:hypothetical protein
MENAWNEVERIWMGTHLKLINLKVIRIKSTYACVNQPNEVSRERGG